MSEAPFLQTERLELWLPKIGDLSAVSEIVSDPETARFLGGQGAEAERVTRFLRSAGSWSLFGYGNFIVRKTGEGEVIGTVGMFHGWRDLGDDIDGLPEAGWIMRRNSAGQGYAGQAMKAALTWFDETHGPRPIYCMIDIGNEPSLKLAERLGFTMLRSAELPGSKVVVNILMRKAQA